MKKLNLTPYQASEESKKQWRLKNKVARLAMAMTLVPDDLRACVEVAASVGGIFDDNNAFFGGAHKKLAAKMSKVGVPMSALDALEKLGIILSYSDKVVHRYVFMDRGFPVSFADDNTEYQRKAGLALVEKHAIELPAIDVFIARYALACSFAYYRDNLRVNMGWLRYLLKAYHPDYSECEAVLESWKGERIILRQVENDYYNGFDVNRLCGDWGQP